MKMEPKGMSRKNLATLLMKIKRSSDPESDLEVLLSFDWAEIEFIIHCISDTTLYELSKSDAPTWTIDRITGKTIF